jgi:hypothetical protein
MSALRTAVLGIPSEHMDHYCISVEAPKPAVLSYKLARLHTRSSSSSCVVQNAAVLTLSRRLVRKYGLLACPEEDGSVSLLLRCAKVHRVRIFQQRHKYKKQGKQLAAKKTIGSWVTQDHHGKPIKVKTEVRFVCVGIIARNLPSNR